MNPEHDPIKKFIESVENLIVAVVGREMSKHGVISKYPENFGPEVEKAKKEMYDYMTSTYADNEVKEQA